MLFHAFLKLFVFVYTVLVYLALPFSIIIYTSSAHFSLTLIFNQLAFLILCSVFIYERSMFSVEMAFKNNPYYYYYCHYHNYYD